MRRLRLCVVACWCARPHPTAVWRVAAGVCRCRASLLASQTKKSSGDVMRCGLRHCGGAQRVPVLIHPALPVLYQIFDTSPEDLRDFADRLEAIRTDGVAAAVTSHEALDADAVAASLLRNRVPLL